MAGLVLAGPGHDAPRPGMATLQRLKTRGLLSVAEINEISDDALRVLELLSETTDPTEPPNAARVLLEDTFSSLLGSSRRFPQSGDKKSLAVCSTLAIRTTQNSAMTTCRRDTPKMGPSAIFLARTLHNTANPRLFPWISLVRLRKIWPPSRNLGLASDRFASGWR